MKKLAATLNLAEQEATDFQVYQIAWMLGSFSFNSGLRELACQCPRITEKLANIEPCRSQAYIRLQHYLRTDDALLSSVAQLIRTHAAKKKKRARKTII